MDWRDASKIRFTKLKDSLLGGRPDPAFGTAFYGAQGCCNALTALEMPTFSRLSAATLIELRFKI